ncbi:hypothetical protein ACFY1A_21160 [Streptomyces sp. NPDC001520]|uniref:hypothetical protein n=1 Tax=Streptomyces sp. NPDC001520 TaxID=3364581 RepID=UPI0036860D8B
MTTSPTPAERAALKVAQAAAMTPDASYDLVSAVVFALGSAQLLQSPETAAELEHLRKDRDAFRNQRNGVFKTNERLIGALQEEQDARLRAQNDVRTLTRERDALRARAAELEAEQGNNDGAKAPWGRAEDGRPYLPEGAHWTDVPELVDRTVAGIQARVDQAQPGHWYTAPATETGLAPGTVRTRVDGYPRTVGQFTNVLPADLELILHAYDDLGWCLEMLAKVRARVAELEAERHTTNEALAELTESTRGGSPWQRATDGLNALVDAGVGFHVEPDGHISNPFGDEHIEFDRAAERWVLTVDDAEVEPHPAPCRVPVSPDCTCVSAVVTASAMAAAAKLRRALALPEGGERS